MNVDLNVYRMRIVSNHLRSARLPHSKRLSSAQLLLDMLFARYKLIDITMFIFFKSYVSYILIKQPGIYRTTPKM